MYSDGEIRQYIREVVSESKKTAKVETGFLKRSIRGALIGKNRSVEFRQIFYGAFNENSKLLEVANRIMPNDIDWKIIFEDDEGVETTIKAKVKGKRVSTKSISNTNQSTSKIKALIASIKANGEKKNDTREGSASDNSEKPERDRP